MNPRSVSRPLVVWVALALPWGGATAASAEDFAPQYRPVLVAERAAGEIRIDGELGDPGWRDAARAVGFAEHSPGDATRPPVDSEAWVAYDDEHLYLAFIARDDPATVRASLCERDNIFRDDYFGIMMDTYGDLAWGYEFFVNPLGIQGDLRINGDGSEEIAFDLVWKSSGRVCASGYQVELAIPFASLRFPEREEQIWRFNIWRDHQRDVRRRYTWSATDRDLSCWMCQWGTLRGMRGIRPGSRVDLIASAVGARDTRRAEADDPTSPLEPRDAEGRLSFNARYGFSSSSSAELTLRPDFSQIESDAAQIDVNTTFALFYPERRPFFQEGSDLYDTWIHAVYTRSINDPQAAVKLTGTFGRATLLYLIARDSNSPVLLPGAEASYQPLRAGGNDDLRSISNILRLRRTFLEDSYVGATLTDRRMTGDAGGVGTVGGLDGRLRIPGNAYVELQALASRTTEPDDTLLTAGLNEETFAGGAHTFGFDGEDYWGHAVHAGLERGARHWSAGVEYLECSPTFRTDNGFTTRNDLRRVISEGGVHFRPNRGLLMSWGANLHLGRRWNHAGEFREDWAVPSLWGEIRGQTTFRVEGGAGRERFRGRRFDDITWGSVEIESHPVEMISLGAEAGASRAIYRTAADPRLADALECEAWASLRPWHRLRIEPGASYYRLRERHGGPEILSGTIVRARLSLQFTRELHVRSVVQYDGFDERLDLEPLLTYRVNPFTVFYLGASASQVEFASGGGSGEERYPGAAACRRWKPVARQYFAKIQYLWRL